jgi:hypothetical protein
MFGVDRYLEPLSPFLGSKSFPSIDGGGVSSERRKARFMNYPDTNYIFFPTNEWKKDDGWFEAKSCIWNAPDWYRAQYQLSRIPEYQSLGFFFVNILKIPLVPQVDEYLEYIVRLKKEHHAARRSSLLRLIYDELNVKATSGEGDKVSSIGAIR